MILHRYVLHVSIAAALVTVGCAKAPPPTAPPALPPITIAAPVEARVRATMTIAASADTNPDANGRPSPVVVRVYQLRSDNAFTNTEFFPLFDDDQKTLGQELISVNEYTLAPADKQSIDISVAGETRFVGVVAAFRDIRNAQWRGIVPAPREGLTVAVERARVVVTPVAGK